MSSFFSLPHRLARCTTLSRSSCQFFQFRKQSTQIDRFKRKAPLVKRAVGFKADFPLQQALRRYCRMCAATEDFGDEDSLSQWLSERGIDTLQYGSAEGSKTIGNLLQEVRQGESCLVTTEEGTPLRRVAIVSVNITNDNGESLVEAKQILPGGRVRERNLLLSEKMLPDEDPFDAAIRGIREELGSILPENPEITILKNTYSTSMEQHASTSYPGLCTEYICHKVDAHVDDLPQHENFTTEEMRPDGVLLSSWEWRVYF